MKILHARFHNLNSLAGTWDIDFTHPEFATNNIFAIIGPTGSGKTTILDAICLALYGRTPRLKQLSKTTNEIMTRQTGTCFAEITFQTVKGRYRCHWSQHRARKQPDGELQPIRHEIVDCATNRVLESKLKEVVTTVTKVTGLSYDQFTRSILLAQGEFNRFLHASSDERAPILEQVTGTAIYSRISQKVHELKTVAAEKAQTLSRELADHRDLTPEQQVEIHSQLEDKGHTIHELETAIEQASRLLAWLTSLEDHKQELQRLQSKEQEIIDQLQQAKSDRRRVALANQARPHEIHYRRLLELQERQHKEQRAHSTSIDQLHQLQKRYAVAEDNAANALQHLTGLKNSFDDAVKVIREAQQLDQQSKHLAKPLNELQQEVATGQNQLNAFDIQLGRLREDLDRNKSELAREESYQDMQARDAQLVDEFSGLKEQLHTCKQLQTRCTELHASCQKLQHELGQLQEQTTAQQTQHDELHQTRQDLTQQYEAHTSEIDQLLAGAKPRDLHRQGKRLQEELFDLEKLETQLKTQQQLRQQLAEHSKQARQFTNSLQDLTLQQDGLAKQIALRQDNIEKQRHIILLAAKIRDYAAERRQLVAGTPCPLCGSLHHPFSTDTPPAPCEDEQILTREKELLAKDLAEQSRLFKSIATLQGRKEQIDHNIQELSSEADVSRKRLDALCIHAGFTVEDITLAAVNSLHQKRTASRNSLQQTIERLEALDEKRDMINQQLHGMDQKIAALGQRLEDCRRNEDKMLTEQHRLKAEQEECERKVVRLQATLNSAIQPYTDLTLNRDNIEEIIHHLKTRRDDWQNSVQRRNQLTLEQQAITGELDKLAALRDEQLRSLQEKTNKTKQLQDQLKTLHTTRHELFGSKDPEQEEQRLQQAIRQAEAQLNSEQQSCNNLAQEISGCKERTENLKQNIDNRSSELKQGQGQFNRVLEQLGCATEEDFRSTLLAPDEYDALTAKLNHLDKEHHAITTQLREKTADCHRETDRKLTNEPADTIRERQQQHRATLARLQQEVGALKQQLADQQQRQQEHAQKRKELLGAQSALEQWGRLHELIGSADGKKFRNFAQGLTFEMMVHHANHALQRMSERYLLIRDPFQPLELSVIDNYQAGEIRSTKNLSGGESFIVSLALALGLSNMASQNVQVDSLFLDEGFGTLDEEALQTALDTFSSLQHEGKLIGIISHIPLLQERISTQIRITPGPGGRSRLSGPGVNG